jgi:hypothetical protein
MMASPSRPGRFARAVLVVMLAVSTAACATGGMEDAARARAANDLKCPEDKVNLVEIGGTSYRAKGCGDSAVYDCTQSAGHSTLDAEYLCVPEGEGHHGSED